MIKNSTHHNLDIHSIPKGKEPLFINEPELIDGSLSYFCYDKVSYDSPDNVRVYVPLDISRESILRRLNYIIARLGAASEYNESDYTLDVSRLINQIEIYQAIRQLIFQAGVLRYCYFSKYLNISDIQIQEFDKVRSSFLVSYSHFDLPSEVSV